MNSEMPIIRVITIINEAVPSNKSVPMTDDRRSVTLIASFVICLNK